MACKEIKTQNVQSIYKNQREREVDVDIDVDVHADENRNLMVNQQFINQKQTSRCQVCDTGNIILRSPSETANSYNEQIKLVEQSYIFVATLKES